MITFEFNFRKDNVILMIFEARGNYFLIILRLFRLFFLIFTVLVFFPLLIICYVPHYLGKI